MFSRRPSGLKSFGERATMLVTEALSDSCHGGLLCLCVGFFVLKCNRCCVNTLGEWVDETAFFKWINLNCLEKNIPPWITPCPHMNWNCFHIVFTVFSNQSQTDDCNWRGKWHFSSVWCLILCSKAITSKPLNSCVEWDPPEAPTSTERHDYQAICWVK